MPEPQPQPAPAAVDNEPAPGEMETAIRDMCSTLNHGVVTHEGRINMQVPRREAKLIVKWVADRWYLLPRTMAMGWIRLAITMVFTVAAVAATGPVLVFFGVPMPLDAAEVFRRVRMFATGAATACFILYLKMFLDLRAYDRGDR